MRKTLGPIGRWTSAAAAVIALGAGALLATPSATAQTGTPAKADLSKAVKKDQIIFRNGQKAEGVILEETETSIRMLVIVGSMRTETTYQKSEILDIKRDAFKAEPAKVEEKKDEKKEDTSKKSAGRNDPANPVDVQGKPIPEGAVTIYFVNFGGEFGRDVSKTPVVEIMDEIAALQPDIVVVRFDNTFGVYGDETVDFDQQAQGIDFESKASELDTLITQRVMNDPAFKKKPRMVAWIHKALGPAALLPFVFKEIYFTSDGLHGGIGGLDTMFGGRGDEVVRQKQYSLRIGRVKGLAAQGGHDERIVKAMTWSDYVLSYKMEGGKAVFIERMPQTADEILLKDDGPVNQDNADSMQDMVRMRGNDYLTLNAKTAFDIGLSGGTADTMDELLSKMGITRNYALMKNRSREVLGLWSRDIAKAENDIGKLLRDYRSVQVRPPGGYKERTAARTKQKTLLRQIQSIVVQYKEALNPRRVGDTDGMMADINVVIDRIDTAQRLDRPD